jgi:hypothetical protein
MSKRHARTGGKLFIVLAFRIRRSRTVLKPYSVFGGAIVNDLRLYCCFPGEVGCILRGRFGASFKRTISALRSL